MGKKLCSTVLKLKNIKISFSIIKQLYNLLNYLKFRHTYIIILYFILGLILNIISHSKISFFIIKELLMLSTLCLGVYSLKKFNSSLVKIQFDVAGDIVLSVLVEKLKRRTVSNLNVLISSIAGLFYIWISIKLNFVLLNPVGIFALVTLYISVFISALLLLNYLYLIILMFQVSKRKIKCIHPQLISKNIWLTEINSIAIYSRNIFFILVSFMVTVFAIFSPKSLWEAILNGHYQTDIYLPAILYILSILIYDLLILPILSYQQYTLTKQIVRGINETNTKKYFDGLKKSPIEENYKYLNSIDLINSTSLEFVKNSKKRITPIVTYIFNGVTLFITFMVNTNQLYQTLFSSFYH